MYDMIYLKDSFVHFARYSDILSVLMFLGSVDVFSFFC